MQILLIKEQHQFQLIIIINGLNDTNCSLIHNNYAVISKLLILVFLPTVKFQYKLRCTKAKWYRHQHCQMLCTSNHLTNTGSLKHFNFGRNIIMLQSTASNICRMIPFAWWVLLNRFFGNVIHSLLLATFLNKNVIHWLKHAGNCNCFT